MEKINITCNKNTVPNETESPMVTSGIRLGTPAMTTRGLKEKDFEQIGEIISLALTNKENKKILNSLKKSVKNITDNYPLYK